jgi:hypothetical protein
MGNHEIEFGRKQIFYLAIITLILAIFALVVPGCTSTSNQPNILVTTSGTPSTVLPARGTITLTPTTQGIIWSQGTPEQIRDQVVASSPFDDTTLGIANRAYAVTETLCKQGFRARTVTFRLFMPGKSVAEEFRAVTVVEHNGVYEYLCPYSNTPAYPLGNSDNPIPSEEAMAGTQLYEGTEYFSEYCS